MLLLIFQFGYAEQTTSIELTGKLSERLTSAIEKYQTLKPEYSDVLGEGPSGWDKGPRYADQTSATNCVTWVDTVLADAYSKSDREKRPLLDRLRYFGGNAAFGLRKHFMEQWGFDDPGPLQELNLSWCAEVKKKNISISLRRLGDSYDYSCPFYGENHPDYEINYVESRGLLDCQPYLKPGFYILMGVAAKPYNRMYGKKNGGMGLVHPVILKIDETHSGTVYFAAPKKIISMTLEQLLTRQTQLMQGHVLFGLDPSWGLETKIIRLDKDQVQKVQDCETQVVRQGKKRRIGL